MCYATNYYILLHHTLTQKNIMYLSKHASLNIFTHTLYPHKFHNYSKREDIAINAVFESFVQNYAFENYNICLQDVYVV